MFCGPLADKNHNGMVEIRGVDSDAFRRLLDFIYNSGPMDWDTDNIDYFNLLDAANMYIIPGKARAINICSSGPKMFFRGGPTIFAPPELVLSLLQIG